MACSSKYVADKTYFEQDEMNNFLSLKKYVFFAVIKFVLFGVICENIG